MKLAKQLAGTWISNNDMPPWANIAGRKWMHADGEPCGAWFSRAPEYR